MLDGLHFDIPSEAVKESDILEFRAYGNGKRATYNGLLITDRCEALCFVRGSIHKYYNEGKHNYDDFKLSDCIKAVNNLKKDFNINPETIEITRIEFGVNLDLSIEVDDFLSYVVSFRNKVPITTEQGLIFKFDDYEVKLYNKKLKGHKDRLRLELVVRRKRKRLDIIKEYAPYCNTLSDILNSNIWRAFSSELVEVFNDIIILDKENINYAILTPKEAELITKGASPFYWSKKWSNRQTRSNHLKTFLGIIEDKCSSNIKDEVRSLIIEKTSILIDVENVPLYQQKGVSNFKSDNLTFSPKMRYKEASSSLTFSPIDKGGNRQDFPQQERRCKITGLNLNIGIPQNDVLSKKGVEYYYHNHRNVFDEVLYPRLSERMKSASLDRQFQAIAHSLRNARSNPRNNLKRSLEDREQGVLMLFSFSDMLREDKKKILKSELKKVSM